MSSTKVTTAQREATVCARLRHGFPYQFIHKHHTGCVNAVALSQDQQHRYLASGGDDTIIRLWDTYAPVTAAPLHLFRGHRANIFSLLFSTDQQHFVSAALDTDIYLYDYARPLQSTSSSSPGTSEPLRCYDTHRSSVHRLAWRSDSSNVFFSASDDHSVGMFDTRAPDCQGLMFLRSAVHAVSSHPLDANKLLVGGRSGLALWDIRKVRWVRSEELSSVSFGRFSRMQQANQDPLFEYDTTDCSVASAYFNHDGSRIIATLTDFFPAYYDTEVAQPLAVLSAQKYRNCVTMKGATFAGPRDSFVVCGSDNFSLYMWDVAAVDKAALRRSGNESEPLVIGASVESDVANMTSPITAPPADCSTQYAVAEASSPALHSIVWPVKSSPLFSSKSPLKLSRMTALALPLPDSAAVAPSINGAPRRALTESDDPEPDDTAAHLQSKRSKISNEWPDIDNAVSAAELLESVGAEDESCEESDASPPPSPPSGDPPPLVPDRSEYGDSDDSADHDMDQEVPVRGPLPILCVPCAVQIGHRSIPNHAVYHPNLFRLYACGVEKSVRIWSLDAFGPAADEKAKDWVELRHRELATPGTVNRIRRELLRSNIRDRQPNDECLQTLLRFDLMIYMEIMHSDVELELQAFREELEDEQDQTLEPPARVREPWRSVVLRALAKSGECSCEREAERIQAEFVRGGSSHQQAAADILAAATANTAESSSDDESDQDEDAGAVFGGMTLDELQEVMGSDIDLIVDEDESNDHSDDSDDSQTDSSDDSSAHSSDHNEDASSLDEIDQDDFDGVVDDHDMLQSLRESDAEVKKDQ